MKSIRFGFQEQWLAFALRNARFVERFPQLESSLHDLFHTRRILSGEIHQVVFLLGEFAMADFWELLLVCGNAEGFAAEKLLRSMYERVWTLLYLKRYPEELDRYLVWRHISEHKLLVAVEKYAPEAKPSPERADEIRTDFKKAKSELALENCDVCGFQRPLSWATRNPVDSAKDLGLGALVVPAYYLPLEHAHPNIGGVTQRVVSSDHTLEPTDRHDPERCDRILVAAHVLLLHAVKGCIGMLGLDSVRYSHLESDFAYAWGTPPNEAVST